MKTIKLIQYAWTTCGAIAGLILGGFDGLLKVLIFFMVADYITGVLCGYYEKKLSSATGFKGICRKLFIVVLVALGNLVDVYVIGNGSMLRTAVIFFYLSNEGISIIENAARLGLPIPKALKAALEQIGKEE